MRFQVGRIAIALTRVIRFAATDVMSGCPGLPRLASGHGTAGCPAVSPLFHSPIPHPLSTLQLPRLSFFEKIKKGVNDPHICA